jgi:DNA-binding XRE family transcriptional regulator
MCIALVLRAARRAAGLSQSQLAYLAEVRQSSIGRAESEGLRMSFSTASKVAAVLGIQVSDLVNTHRDFGMTKDQIDDMTIWYMYAKKGMRHIDIADTLGLSYNVVQERLNRITKDRAIGTAT